MYFKASQLPLRKKVTDTEIGKKQQSFYGAFLRGKEKKRSSSHPTNPPTNNTLKRCYVINRNKQHCESNTVSVIMIKSTHPPHYLQMRNIIIKEKLEI